MVIIGSDHSGVDLRNHVAKYLSDNNIEYLDVNDILNDDPNDDYPDIAFEIAKQVLKDENNKGIAICGTGIGISVACNKVNGIVAANCIDVDMANLSRKHNNANVLCLGARLKLVDSVYDIVNAFLNTAFEEGRHIRRLNKIAKIEEVNRGGTSYGNGI